MSRSNPSSWLSDEVRRCDPDRWICALFAPPALRDGVMALLLLNHELARVPEIVSQPVAGMIRYQWWRDSIVGAAEGRPRAHPVVEALSPMLVTGRLDREELLGMIDARERDLDNLAPEDLQALEGYARATAGAVQAGTALQLGGDPASVAAARAIGCAYGLVGIVRAVASMATQGRSLLPASLTTELGIEPAGVLASQNARAVSEALRRIAERAVGMLDEVEPTMHGDATAAMLPSVIARSYAHRMAATGFDPASAAVVTRPPLMPLRLWWMFRRASRSAAGRR